MSEQRYDFKRELRCDNFVRIFRLAPLAADYIEQLEQRAEAAEARIKNSQTQRPRAWETNWEGSLSLSFVNPKIGAMSAPLYAQPPIPPDVAELQRQLEEARKVPEWYPTDKELTRIYNDANGIAGGKNPPISTERIFTAMRAMLSAAHTTDQ